MSPIREQIFGSEPLSQILARSMSNGCGASASVLERPGKLHSVLSTYTVILWARTHRTHQHSWSV